MRRVAPNGPGADESHVRDRILVAAARLFRQKGYSGATTREIASVLGLQHGSLYYHIEKKEDLLYALSVDAMTNMLQQVSSALDAAATQDQPMRRLIAAHLSALLADRDQHLTAMVELRNLGGNRRREVIALRDQYEELIRGAIADAQASGQIRSDVSPKHLSLALLNLLNWTMFWYAEDGPLDHQQLADLLYDLFVHGAGGSA